MTICKLDTKQLEEEWVVQDKTNQSFQLPQLTVEALSGPFTFDMSGITSYS